MFTWKVLVYFSVLSSFPWAMSCPSRCGIAFPGCAVVGGICGVEGAGRNRPQNSLLWPLERCPSHPTVPFMRPRGRNVSVSFRVAVLLPSGCLACIFNLVLRCSKSGQFSLESAAPHNQHAALCHTHTAVSVSVPTLACRLPCLHWISYFKLYFRLCYHLIFLRFFFF